MSMRRLGWVVFLGIGWIAAGCMSGGGEEEAQTVTRASETGELRLTAPWARPGGEGGMSAFYLRIENGTGTEDTLQAVRTDVADTAEIHESYEAEDGTRGMRPTGPVRLPAGQQVAFTPGGLHVMLLRLRQELEVGDSLVVDLQFAGAGIQSVNVPVRMEPPPS